MKFIEDRSDTPCHQDCCKVAGYPGHCHQQWTCHHHKEDFDRARAQQEAAGLTQELSTRSINYTAPSLSATEKRAIESLYGKVSATDLAPEYGVEPRTISRVWRGMKDRDRKRALVANRRTPQAVVS